MNRPNRLNRTAAALTVALTAAAATLGLALTGTGAVADALHPAKSSTGGYGYQAVRQGVPTAAARFTVSSPDVREGGAVPPGSWADNFGCSGGNGQLRLAWHGAPANTRSYAVTMYDPDAPTGAGFWHWLTWDVPSTATALGATPPAGSVVGTNDAGRAGYLGPCPPVGDITHRYQITVYALDVPSLGLPAATPPSVTTFTMSGHILGYARMTATARR
ncbi:YbhB/YbcL family Raf kinase inhibitor-like protein [Kitasatospora sp. McL0602]|uniref:YbhB/YbcL family Raf kinase inhibitor-like protein n=1 Tax=Kitasatospora sp. McL0602 TaxID=3439530 RepID=UPI003F8CA1CA